MTITLLNIANKIDPATVSVYEAVSNAAASLKLPYFVVGASARDLVMQHGYGAKVERATQDVDFGIQVADWNAFDALKATLEEQGFNRAKVEHRLYSKEGTPVDIVPFGGTQDGRAQIAWPPKGEWVMSVLGFQEAYVHALQVRIQENPFIDIPVASPEGMMLLKLIAWTDRPKEKRAKDAEDIFFLLKSYEKIPAIADTLYDNEDLMDSYGWDITFAAAQQLGSNTAAIASSPTEEAINNLFRNKLKNRSVDLLVGEVGERVDYQFERNHKIMAAFIHGFTSQ